MTAMSTERQRWLSTHIFPLESQLRAWLRRVTPAGLEVDDLIQEAYARLASLATVTTITQPKAYLYQIVKRLMSEHIRRANVVSIEDLVEVSQLTIAGEGFSPERILSGRQELARLYAAIGMLPARCREVFVMRKFLDKSQRMIAAELQISENTVEKRMSRALLMLTKYLNAGREEGEPQPRADGFQTRHQRDG